MQLTDMTESSEHCHLLHNNACINRFYGLVTTKLNVIMSRNPANYLKKVWINWLMVSEDIW